MKIVNGKKKSDYSMHKWRDAAYKQFETVDDVKVGLAKWINLFCQIIQGSPFAAALTFSLNLLTYIISPFLFFIPCSYSHALK